MKNAINRILKYEKLVPPETLLYWGHFRIKFQYAYLKILGLLDETDFKVSSISFSDKIKYVFYCFSKINIYRLLFSGKRILIFSHPRAPQGIDINTKSLQEKYDGDALIVTHSEKFVFQGDGVDCYTDILRVVAKLFAKIIFPFFKLRRKNLISFLDSLEISGKNKRKLLDMYVINSLEYDLLYLFYTFWFSLAKFEKVYLVTGYYNVPLIAAAKRKGLYTIEVQHGVISKYHIGYNCNIPNAESFFSDCIYFWGDYWKISCNLPPFVKKLTYGTEHSNFSIKSVSKKNNSVVIISQTSISSIVEDFIDSNLKFFNNYSVYIKLHPGEFSKYEKLNDKYKFNKNVSVISNQLTLEELLEFCEYQIGAYSTGVYQGIISGCKTVLINSPGIYYMEAILSDSSVMISEQTLDFGKFSTLSTPSFREDYFFSPILSDCN